MSQWKIHWLEAGGDLTPWHAEIASEVEATEQLVSGLVVPPSLDILMQRNAWVIPEIGMVGQSYRHDLFSLTLDPGNPNFHSSLANGTLRRQVAHEVHHCLRFAKPGYGRTLGEALVSEGLAGHFVKRLFGSAPEPWECAVDTATAAAFFSKEALGSTSYDHAAWFFGAGGRYPRWLGYTLGYLIAGRWCDAEPDADGVRLARVPAADVLAAW